MTGGDQTFFWDCKTLSRIPLGRLFGAFLGLLTRKFDKVNARLSFSPKILQGSYRKCYKTFIFHIFLGFSKIYCVPLSHHIPIEVPPAVSAYHFFAKLGISQSRLLDMPKNCPKA